MFFYLQEIYCRVNAPPHGSVGALGWCARTNWLCSVASINGRPAESPQSGPQGFSAGASLASRKIATPSLTTHPHPLFNTACRSIHSWQLAVPWPEASRRFGRELTLSTTMVSHTAGKSAASPSLNIIFFPPSHQCFIEISQVPASPVILFTDLRPLMRLRESDRHNASWICPSTPVPREMLPMGSEKLA